MTTKTALRKSKRTNWRDGGGGGRWRVNPRSLLAGRRCFVKRSHQYTPYEHRLFCPVSQFQVRGRQAKGAVPTSLFPSNYVKISPVDGAGQVLVGALSSTHGQRSSGAQLQTRSDDAVDNSIADGNGGGRLSPTHGEVGSDHVTREDGDRHRSFGWIVEKTDCLAETAAETSARPTDGTVPGGNARFILRSRSSNMALSTSHDATSFIDVPSVCLGRDYLLPRPTLTRAFVPTTAQTAADDRHNTGTCDDQSKTPYGGLLKRGIVGRERDTEIPNAGESSDGPAHGHWSATHGRSQLANITMSPDKDNTCRRHGMSSCVLCGDSYFHLDGKSSSLNAPPVGDPMKRGGGVKIVACASTGLIDVTGDASCGTRSLDEQRLSAADAVVISRETECVPCGPHLLPNCVLCKMQKGRLGRSASLPALGPTTNGACETDISASSRVRISKPNARHENHCEPHDMSGCLLCDDPGSTAPVSKSDRFDSRGVHDWVEPLLRGHLPPFSQPRQDVRPDVSPRLFKVSSKPSHHGEALDIPVVTTAGDQSAEGTPRVFTSNTDDDDAVPAHRRSRFPPAAGPRRSGIGRGVSNKSPLGDDYACYDRETENRCAGDAYAGISRGERHRRDKSLARSWQSSSSKAGNPRPDAATSGYLLRESDSDVNDFVARALMAARAVL